MNKDLFDEIARVAYELYEKRGRVPGCHFDDWIEAEKIVLVRHTEKSSQEVRKTRAARVKKAAGETAQKKTRKITAKTPAKTTEPRRRGAPKKKEE